MKRYSALLLLSAALGIPAAQADTISYGFGVDTSGIVSPTGGYIDFEFNQANDLDSLSATATITSFYAEGFTFDSPALTSAGVTGDLFSPPPVVIPNDQSFANYFTQPVDVWGSVFYFVVQLSGDAVGTSAPDGSAFYVFLLDRSYNTLAGSLSAGEVLNVTIGTDGVAVREDSELSGPVPEPGTLWMGLGVIAVAAWKRRA